jgi:non-specific serine/threonine protein kinase
LIERFSSVPGAALPMPRAVESVTHPAMPPSPVLRVHKHVFGDHWRKMEMIIGEVLFQYGDSPRLQSPSKSTPSEYSALRDGKRVTWPRDLKAERAAENRLLIAGTRLISSVIPSALLGSATYHAVIPSEPYPTPELAWIELLEGPEFAKLRDAGWTIEVDPACGLTLRDVTDFIPAIEAETDHGIDWFRFDVSYEIDGQKVSLIPVIAHAIARNLPSADSPDLPEFLLLPAGDQPEDGFIRFPAKPLMEIVDQVRHLFQGGGDPGRIDRLTAAGMADALAIDSSETVRTLAKLGKSLRDLRELPEVALPPICPIPPDAAAAAACCAMNCAMNDPSFANGNWAIEYRETATLYSKKAKLSKYSAHELGHKKKKINTMIHIVAPPNFCG